jgi:hypothetical protein
MLMNRTEGGHTGMACHTRLVSCRVAASSNQCIEVAPFGRWDLRFAAAPHARR